MASAIALGVDPTPYLRTSDRVERLLWQRALGEAWEQRRDTSKLERKYLADDLGGVLARLIGRMFR